MKPDAREAIAMIPKEPRSVQTGIVAEKSAQIMIQALVQGYNANDGRSRPLREGDWKSLLDTNASHPVLNKNLEKISGLFERCMQLYQPSGTRPKLESQELNHITDTFSHEILSCLVIRHYVSVNSDIASFEDITPHQHNEIQERYDRALEALYANAPKGSNRDRYFERLTTGKVIAQILMKPDILLGG